MSASKRMIASRVVKDLQRRATGSANVLPVSTDIVQQVNKQDTSGLTPYEVGLTLAVLVGVFILLLFVGGLCKLFNKPRKEARPYINGPQKLFQPSAAGYGTRIAGLKPSEVNNIHGSRVSLLAGASPMGRGGHLNDLGDSTIGTPNSSGSGHDYFGRAGHTRGQSTGVSLPGATAASSRRGGGSAHPPVQGSSVGPDGSGFRPGQVFNYGGAGPSGYTSRPNGLTPPAMEGNKTGSAANVGLGPPPATDARRRSRYTRADGRRIDSVGPGVIRKSMYLGDDLSDAQQSTPRLTPTNMRRVDSVGRGDHRRKSTYLNADASRRSRSASIYNAGPESQADNFGAGQGGDPLGVKNSTLSPNMRARQMRGISPNAQMPSMPPIQRQYSNGMPPSPGAMNGVPTIGKPMLQQQPPQQQQPQPPMANYPLPPAGYPGGGAPRIRPNQQFAPMAGGYDRGPRQIV